MLARMSRAPLLAILGLAAAACTPTLGPPPPGPMTSPSGNAAFSAADFDWSKKAGANTIAGRVAYRQGPTPFTCSGATVVLTPETPWSRRRMAVLYGSTERAALPADEVRARGASAPPGDANPYVRRDTCNSADGFIFSGLPDGAWYVIAITKPAGGGQGPSVALMRRVVTRGGRAVNLVL
jgi:hypothetical protein